MTTEQYIKQYQDWEMKISAYDLALTTMSFDSHTVAPKAGNEYRNTRDAYLSGVYFSLLTDENFIQLLDEMAKLDDLPEDIAKAVAFRIKDINKIRFIPQDVFVECNKLMSDSYDVWEQAKKNNDYAAFSPYLKKMIEKSKDIFTYRKEDTHPYDMALDDYEMGMTQEKYDDFFAKVKTELVPLILKIKDKQDQVDTSFLKNDFAISKQKEFMECIMDYMDFDRNWGYLSESAHPFSSMFSINDIRITTRYAKDSLVSGIFSIIHEIGHGTYSHQVDIKHDGTYLADNMTSGMHESQSRLFENYLGRTEAYWKTNYSKLQQLFPEQLATVSIEQFARAVNSSCPSLIRTEADELTYPIHIYIRYELEKKIFNNDIDLDNLNNIWNDMYEENLGVRASTDTEGILQDVHWSGGSFGYFPTYALGSAYAAQFMHAMRSQIDVDDCLARGDFKAINSWLKENIHQHGGYYTPEEILISVTNEPFNPQYYIDYLKDKYSRLYNID